MGVCELRHVPAGVPPGKRTGTHFAEIGWNPGLLWTGAERFAPTGIRSPDRPVRNESLYGLRYPGALFQSVRK
jgi:hypothetical protein